MYDVKSESEVGKTETSYGALLEKK